MAFTEGAAEGATNGTSEVAIVAAPGSATRRIIKMLEVHNKDTAAVTLTVSKKKASTKYRIQKVTLQPDGTWRDNETRILDATDETIVVELGGAVATTEPSYNTTYADVS